MAAADREHVRRVYVETGGNGEETARRTGVNRKRVRAWCADLKLRVKGGETAAPVPAVPKSAVDEMRRAAERHAPPVSAYDDDDEPLGEVWRRAEEKAARAIRKAESAATFRGRAPGQHLLLTAVSDQHIAPGTPVDFRAMREDAELVAATPNCFAVAAGDGVDNHIKHKAAMLAARSQPEDQYRLFEYYLSIFADRLLVVTSGNHDNWTNQFGGVDVMARIARDRRVCYAPDEAFLDVGVGSQAYSVAVRHQYRYNSSFNQTHAVKQWLRMGERDFDVGVIGHHHDHACESFVWRGKMRWGCRPGSYQITSAHSREKGYNRSVPTCPTFLLRGDTHEITGFPTLRQAVASVRALRELGVS
jgi:hypothetical protein